MSQAPAPAPPALDRATDDEARTRFLTTTRVAVGPPASREEFDREWARLARLVPARRPLRVLDVGCGSGPWFQRWIEVGARVTGVDFDLGLVRNARSRPELVPYAPPADGSPPHYQVAVADATRLPLAEDSFDLITLNSLLEHVPGWHDVVAEAARVCAPGGVVVLHTANAWHPFQGEINHFPFYPWLPAGVKRRVLAWIMVHRRDLVNWTDYPAIHWFSYPQLKAALDRLGMDAFDRLDLTDPASLSGLKSLGRPMLGDATRGRNPVGRGLYYVLAGTVSLYARKRAQVPPA
jgi:2-polyprenyl-6-hydroxyphenyl methylase/3-demethylubiquinone-9 3-methyltransferase